MMGSSPQRKKYSTLVLIEVLLWLSLAVLVVLLPNAFKVEAMAVLGLTSFFYLVVRKELPSVTVLGIWVAISADIPQVSCRLTSRSPDFARWASVFRPERCLSSRKRPKSGGSSLEPAAFWPGRAAFPRGRRTCPAAFVQLGHGSWSCA